MTWFLVAVAVVLVGCTVAAVLGRVDGALADPTRSLQHEPLPSTPLVAADFDELRFDTGLRGYRMGQVDGVIERLRLEIADLDEEVARLRGEGANVTPGGGDASEEEVGDEPAGVGDDPDQETQPETEPDRMTAPGPDVPDVADVADVADLSERGR